MNDDEDQNSGQNQADDQARDQVFSRPLSEVKAFEFNETVAGVFHDMISRSVPGYALLLRMIGLYASIFVQPGSRVYDLGCSLGEASLVIADQSAGIDRDIIAVDSSSAMIDKCRQHPDKANDMANDTAQDIEWRCADIRATDITNASMVVLNLTLQFLPPAERLTLLRTIFNGLRPGGVLVLSEKVVFADATENQRMQQLYQGFKKTMGYSDLEISQKRTALENVLIADDEQQHQERLKTAGFSEIYQCFRGFNFVSYLAIKS
jgi:tRNA (cmo5U34)-methyltransferase